MYIWMMIIGGSAACGLMVALLMHRRSAVYIAGAIPWFCILIALVSTVYFFPEKYPDASMWPVAQLFAGTIAAATGVMAFNTTRRFLPQYTGG